MKTRDQKMFTKNFMGSNFHGGKLPPGKMFPRKVAPPGKCKGKRRDDKKID